MSTIAVNDTKPTPNRCASPLVRQKRLPSQTQINNSTNDTTKIQQSTTTNTTTTNTTGASTISTIINTTAIKDDDDDDTREVAKSHIARYWIILY